MDPEKNTRLELMKALERSFYCFEEVDLRHALYTDRVLRADVVAVPIDDRFADLALAFEVKNPSYWKPARLSQAVKQASDYVLATIERGRGIDNYLGRSIACSFVFPIPSRAQSRDEREFFMMCGIAHVGSYFRVGSARFERAFDQELQEWGTRTVLTIPNEVWRSDVGWCGQDPRGVLAGKRRLGSMRVNLLPSGI